VVSSGIFIPRIILHVAVSFHASTSAAHHFLNSNIELGIEQTLYATTVCWQTKYSQTPCFGI
jgi:hypothetical protein